MALLQSSASVLGSEAPAFSLLGVDGKTYSLDSFRSHRGLLVVFMCNHCPYVIAIHERLSRLAREFESKGIAVVGINSNDPLYKDDDSYPNMIRVASEWKLPFPYLFDETQSVARSYDAVCTPDPYLYEMKDGRALLRYRGRIDDSWKDESLVKEQSLKLAMEALVEGSLMPENQVPSMGCSIKWKELTAEALERKRSYPKSFIQYVRGLLIFSILVILWGAYVRATSSGAGCGAHWPLCNGEIIPRPERIQTWIEFIHRATSGLSLIGVGIAFFWARKVSEKGSNLRRAAFFCVLAILLEAILGAGLVLLKLVEFDQSLARAISISLHLVNTLFLLMSLTHLNFWAGRARIEKEFRFFPKDPLFRLCLGLFIFLGTSGAITALGDTLFPATSLMAGMQEEFKSSAHFLLKLRVVHPLFAVSWIFTIFLWSKKLEEVEFLGIRAMLLGSVVLQFLIGFLNWMWLAPNSLQILHLLAADLVFILFFLSGLKYETRKSRLSA